MQLTIIGVHRGSFADKEQKDRTVKYAKVVHLAPVDESSDAKGWKGAETNCDYAVIEQFQGPGVYECGFILMPRKTGTTVKVTSLKFVKKVEVAA